MTRAFLQQYLRMQERVRRLERENDSLLRLYVQYRDELNQKHPPVFDAFVVQQTQAQAEKHLKVLH
jgi:hypothetical protein